MTREVIEYDVVLYSEKHILDIKTDYVNKDIIITDKCAGYVLWSFRKEEIMINLFQMYEAKQPFDFNLVNDNVDELFEEYKQCKFDLHFKFYVRLDYNGVEQPILSISHTKDDNNVIDLSKYKH